MTPSCQWATRSMSCGSAVHLSWISHASHKIPQPPILLVTARSPHVIVYPVYPVWRAWRACSGPGVTLVNFSTSLVIKYFCKFCSRCSEALLMTAIMCAVSTMEGCAGEKCSAWAGHWARSTDAIIRISLQLLLQKAGGDSQPAISGCLFLEHVGVLLCLTIWTLQCEKCASSFDQLMLA